MTSATQVQTGRALRRLPNIASTGNPLLTPFSLGWLVLPNRVVMAPLTRARADAHGVPSPLAPLYYSQRASAGLIISEATTVSPQAVGYDGWPGIYTEEQAEGWRAVTHAVHAAGGRIFIQLFHAGRMSHPVFHGGELPVGPSAIAAGPSHELYDNAHKFVRPRALALAELPGVIDQFRSASELALEAGFDGVEVHAGNGYLLDQFLCRASNQRSDSYGGSPQNHVRLTREVVEAVLQVWGAERVGVRISPLSPTNGMSDADPHGTFGHAAEALDALGIAYLHVIEPGVNGTLSEAASDTSPDLGSGYFRALFSGPIIAAGGHDARTGAARIAKGDADLVAYGKLYIANPDLPERFARRATLNAPDRATFYGGGARGYTDYLPLGTDDLLDGDTQAA
jgi:N-ethylmaleimide reductase